MAITSTTPIYNTDGTTVAKSQLLADPAKYSSLSDFVDPSKPDNRDLLVKTFGDQGITGFLQLTGAVKAAAVNDEIQWWEEGRLHNIQEFNNLGDGTAPAGTMNCVDDNGDALPVYVQKNDVIMTEDNQKLIVTGVSGTAVSVSALDGTVEALAADTGNRKAMILGNMYAQGSEQPQSFNQPTPIKRTNPFMIVKGNFEVNGSQATNIGWIDLGGGEYRWYLKGEQDTRKRFMDHREMMLLFGEKAVAAGGAATPIDVDGDVNGSEGYFAAIEDRGIVCSAASLTTDFSQADANGLDGLILELDKQGGASEYAMYLNRATELGFDDALAKGLGASATSGVMGQFGAFNNDRDMAIQLGFKTATRGGYTFHKHGWKLMNDPTLAGAVGTYAGALVPLTEVADPGTGEKAPALELNYKAVNGYSRELEHWVTGGGVLGHTNNTKDTATFSYRSEIALCTRAANRHVLVKG
jgi:hypothetical protein